MFTNPLTCLISLKSETQFVRFDPRGQLYKQWKKTQSCPTLCDSMACNPPGFSVHGILQVRRLAWVATPFFRGSSQPRDQNQISCSAGSLFVCLFVCFYHLSHQVSPSRDWYSPEVSLLIYLVFEAGDHMELQLRLLSIFTWSLLISWDSSQHIEFRIFRSLTSETS